MSRRPGGDFTPEQDAVLRKHYVADGAQYCAKRIAKTPKQVVGRANRLGLSAPRKPVERFDDRALAAALGMHRVTPRIHFPSRAAVHRCTGER